MGVVAETAKPLAFADWLFAALVVLNVVLATRFISDEALKSERLKILFHELLPWFGSTILYGVLTAFNDSAKGMLQNIWFRSAILATTATLLFLTWPWFSIEVDASGIEGAEILMDGVPVSLPIASRLMSHKFTVKPLVAMSAESDLFVPPQTFFTTKRDLLSGAKRDWRLVRKVFLDAGVHENVRVVIAGDHTAGVLANPELLRYERECQQCTIQTDGENKRTIVIQLVGSGLSPFAIPTGRYEISSSVKCRNSSTGKSNLGSTLITLDEPVTIPLKLVCGAKK